MPGYAWIIPGYVWFCLKVHKSVWIAFILHLPIVIPYLKEQYTFFFESKNLIFFYSSWSYSILFFDFRLNIFTIKVPNLLLPSGAEVAGCFESYPTSAILNRYIYNGFLLNYLSISLLLFFPFLELQRS